MRVAVAAPSSSALHRVGLFHVLACCPKNSFPTYAYMLGKHPHLVRDPLGHSYQNEPVTVAVEEALGSDVFR